MAALVDGRYELIEVIGSGGMATVWRARDVRLERQVAVKRPHPMPPGDPRLDRLSREARLAASISHPHLVSVHDAGADADGLYLVMELVQAPSLAQIGSSLTPDRVLETGIQVSRALAAVHRAGIVHRDVKPGNILMADGGAKLTDFGIAVSETPPAGHQPTLPGAVLATANYAAPEVLAGHPATDRSDVFALGVVLYELLAGQPPFAGVDRTRRPPTLAGVTGPILDRCLSPYPEDRPSAATMAAELNGALADLRSRSMPSSAMARAPIVAPGVVGATTGVRPVGPDPTATQVMGSPVMGSPVMGSPVTGSRPPMIFGDHPGSAAPPPARPVSPVAGPPSGRWIGPAVFGVIAVAAVVTVLALLSGVLSRSSNGDQQAGLDGSDEPETAITVPSTDADEVIEETESTSNQADDGSGQGQGQGGENQGRDEDGENRSGNDDGNSEDGNNGGGRGFGLGGLFDSLGEVDDFVDSVSEKAAEIDATAKDVREVMKKVEEATEKAKDGKTEEAVEKLEDAARRVSERLDGESRDQLLNLLDDVAEELDLPELNLRERFGEDGADGNG
ncbi:MAG: protein kinase [Acidimicrobiia bacterium]|nr:protein kinase [Acidimicrobiia bacterium]